MNNYFYDIPVYRTDEESDKQSYENFLKTNILKFNLYKNDNPGCFDEKRLILYEQNVHTISKNAFGGGWRYNQIVGYVRLYFSGNQVLGEWWCHTGKKIHRTTKRQIERSVCHKLAPEEDVDYHLDSASIFAVIMEYIKQCKQELPKGRYLDTSLLEKIGPYLDWRRLLRSSRFGN